MIKQHTQIDFGNGDVSIRCALDDKAGLLLFDSDEPQEIGKLCDVTGQMVMPDDIIQASLVLTFSNVESIDALMHILGLLRENMIMEEYIRKDRQENRTKSKKKYAKKNS